LRYGDEYESKVTNKWIGGMLSKRLGLKPLKSHGAFVIPVSELPRLKRLCEKYGVSYTWPTAVAAGHPLLPDVQAA
jgi:hypothetical protein